MLQVSPRANKNLFTILVYSIFWLLGSFLYTIIEQGILGEALTYPSTGAPYNFSNNLFTAAVFAFVFGTLFGILEVKVLKPRLKKQTFRVKLIAKSGIFLALTITMMFTMAVVLNMLSMGHSILHPEVYETAFRFFRNFAFWSIIIFITCIMIVVQFFIEVFDSVGKSLLLNFLTGRYHEPQIERRIFMFLDLKNSTPMAESLGHVRYFSLLNTFFSDMSDPILESWGEIYQYVGDEIVVSWPWERGVSDNNCIDCFYRISKKISERKQHYADVFGVIPEFRAGIHGGEVSVGEIGTLKKDILFTGDILNATSRIMSMCKDLEAPLLVSSMVVSDLKSLHKSYRATSAGECSLRGKSEKIELFQVGPQSGIY